VRCRCLGSIVTAADDSSSASTWQNIPLQPSQCPSLLPPSLLYTSRGSEVQRGRFTITVPSISRHSAHRGAQDTQESLCSERRLDRAGASIPPQRLHLRWHDRAGSSTRASRATRGAAARGGLLLCYSNASDEQILTSLRLFRVTKHRVDWFRCRSSPPCVSSCAYCLFVIFPHALCALLQGVVMCCVPFPSEMCLVSASPSIKHASLWRAPSDLNDLLHTSIT